MSKFVLVPAEATGGMRGAGWYDAVNSTPSGMYAAMLSARPPIPEEEVEGLRNVLCQSLYGMGYQAMGEPKPIDVLARRVFSHFGAKVE